MTRLITWRGAITLIGMFCLFEDISSMACLTPFQNPANMSISADNVVYRCVMIVPSLVSLLSLIHQRNVQIPYNQYDKMLHNYSRGASMCWHGYTNTYDAVCIFVKCIIFNDTYIKWLQVIGWHRWHGAVLVSLDSVCHQNAISGIFIASWKICPKIIL